MIDVETTAPVYSMASGKPTRSDRKQSRSEARATRRSNRKAKRNARKLKRVKLRNGRTAVVYVLSRLRPVKKSGADESLTMEYVKTYPDGTTGVVKAEDVVKTTDGKFYDRNEIAKAFGVEKTAVTQQMIDRFIIPVAPTSDATTTTTEVPKSENSDGAVVVPDTKVVTDANGDQFLADDTKAEGDLLASDDVKEDDQKAQGGMSKRQKYILWGGIGLVALIIGVVVYRKMSKKG